MRSWAVPRPIKYMPCNSHLNENQGNSSHLKATSSFFFSRSILSCWAAICFTTTNRHDGASTAASPCSGNTAWETHPFISTFWVIRLSTLTPLSQFCSLLLVKSINVAFVTYSVYCFAGSPGLIIRTRTWIYQFQSSAYMVTMMTQLGWVFFMRKRCLLHDQRCKQM